MALQVLDDDALVEVLCEHAAHHLCDHRASTLVCKRWHKLLQSNRRVLRTRRGTFFASALSFFGVARFTSFNNVHSLVLHAEPSVSEREAVEAALQVHGSGLAIDFPSLRSLELSGVYSEEDRAARILTELRPLHTLKLGPGRTNGIANATRLLRCILAHAAELRHLELYVSSNSVQERVRALEDLVRSLQRIDTLILLEGPRAHDWRATLLAFMAEGEGQQASGLGACFTIIGALPCLRRLRIGLRCFNATEHRALCTAICQRRSDRTTSKSHEVHLELGESPVLDTVDLGVPIPSSSSADVERPPFRTLHLTGRLDSLRALAVPTSVDLRISRTQPNLTRLDLSGPSRAAVLRGVQAAFSLYSPSLRELTLRSQPGLESLYLAPRAGSPDPPLTSLKLLGCGNLKTLSLRSLKSLSHLSLDGCAALQSLRLEGCGSQPAPWEGALNQSLARVMRGAAGSARRLPLRLLHVTPPSSTSTGSGDGTTSNAGLRDEALAAIAELCPVLEECNLSYNSRLTDVGVACLIAHCPRLTSLSLYNVRACTDAILRAIEHKQRAIPLARTAADKSQDVGAPDGQCHKLGVLDVRWTAVTRDGVSWLRSKLPRVRVLHLGATTLASAGQMAGTSAGRLLPRIDHEQRDGGAECVFASAPCPCDTNTRSGCSVVKRRVLLHNDCDGDVRRMRREGG